jgi:hypothetical protein
MRMTFPYACPVSLRRRYNNNCDAALFNCAPKCVTDYNGGQKGQIEWALTCNNNNNNARICHELLPWPTWRTQWDRATTYNWNRLKETMGCDLRSRDKTSCCWCCFSSFKWRTKTITKKMTCNRASHVCVLCFGQLLMEHYSMFERNCPSWKLLARSCLEKK